MLKRIIIGVVVFIGLGAGYSVLHPGAKSCNSLVDTSNSAVEQYNTIARNATDVNSLTGLISTLRSTATKMRADASDYKSPFDSDARVAADRMDAMAAAIDKGNPTGIDAAAASFNVQKDKINSDCRAAR